MLTYLQAIVIRRCAQLRAGAVRCAFGCRASRCVSSAMAESLAGPAAKGASTRGMTRDLLMIWVCEHSDRGAGLGSGDGPTRHIPFGCGCDGGADRAGVVV